MPNTTRITATGTLDLSDQGRSLFTLASLLVTSTGGIGTVEVREGTGSDPIKFKVSVPANDTLFLPDINILFRNDVHVTLSGAEIFAGWS